MSVLDEQVTRIEADLVNLLVDLHRHPELGFQEFRTAEKCAAFMEEAGLDVQTGIGGTGVAGLLHGENPGPTLAIRACLDALPVTEQSGLSFSSCNPGVMHACGHDGNMVMALGAAKILAQHRSEIHGNIKFIFQPSEENTGGAAAMIEAGVLENPHVDAIVTLHNFHNLSQGRLVVKAGPVMASSDLFKLEVVGKAGHGAWPHLAVDPIPIAAELVLALQKIVSREIDPSIPAMLSLGKIEGGAAENVISETVALYGTVRTFDEGVRTFIEQRIAQITEGITRAARATYRLDYRKVMPALVNDAKLADFAGKILRQACPEATVTDHWEAGLGCEEFSLFLERVPGLFLFIGNDVPGAKIVSIHAPEYIFNQNILTMGVRALSLIALGFTQQ